MTFEDTDSRASATGTDQTRPAPRRRAALPPQWTNKAADEMLGFVDQAALIADDLRGLSKLLSGIFEVDCTNLSVAEDAALRIVGECIEGMAKRLDANAEYARERRNHLAAGGAR
ncbi:hypothetical protein [Lichenibacterium ramalinae]|uniref:Uncharacterized protein n=1 Tax=Lichenibacterium ramalinae TaxID=2316527 RepID=A0A4Q2RAW0_9HYPH|nr:hypothetical protein [Lichenibacterium ramalinae]RYB02038.1 hypothetical protein D3272_23005 [Lichenibacterium ramalinae]